MNIEEEIKRANAINIYAEISKYAPSKEILALAKQQRELSEQLKKLNGELERAHGEEVQRFIGGNEDLQFLVEMYNKGHLFHNPTGRISREVYYKVQDAI